MTRATKGTGMTRSHLDAIAERNRKWLATAKNKECGDSNAGQAARDRLALLRAIGELFAKIAELEQVVAQLCEGRP